MMARMSSRPGDSHLIVWLPDHIASRTRRLTYPLDDDPPERVTQEDDGPPRRIFNLLGSVEGGRRMGALGLPTSRSATNSATRVCAWCMMLLDDVFPKSDRTVAL